MSDMRARQIDRPWLMLGSNKNTARNRQFAGQGRGELCGSGAVAQLKSGEG
jgi:hypothetical protein